ncbi:MAG: DNRLRE domain-containing protein [Ignavibacteria bacterium]|nr:DNRLRE domain-containing protein [Ignavibacteria bacterium]
MKFIRFLFLSSLLLSVIYITGCSDGPTTSVDPTNTGVQLSKFSLPPGATLVSADFKIFLLGGNSVTINIHRMTNNWDENTVNWGNRGTYDPTVEAFFNMGNGYTNNDWLTVNIKDLVQKWLDGVPNYGLLLDQLESLQESSSYSSSESVNVPYIEIVYSTSNGNQTVILPALEDAYIWAFDPNYTGNGLILYTGYANGYEKQSLLKFDIEYTPQVVCETAYAYDSDNLPGTVGTCFNTMGFGNWGWSIKLPGPGSYTFDVYAGAGQCNTANGKKVGTVIANYTGGTVVFTYNFFSGFSSTETHFYAGLTPTPLKNGNPTVAPGQYTVKTGLSGPIYIIAHAVVCSSNWN